MKPIITLLTALLLAPLAALHAAEPKTANKPNVIVILADDKYVLPHEESLISQVLTGFLPYYA